MSSDKNVWILAEHSGGKLIDASLEVLNCGRQMAADLGGQICAVVVGSDGQELIETLARYGADKVYLLHSPLLSEYRAELYVKALSNLIEEEKPEIFLCGATSVSRDLAPRLAARLRTGLISECISIALNEEGLLLGTKLTHGGRVNITIAFHGSKPQIATVKPGVMSIARPDAARKAEVAIITPELSQSDCRTSIKGVVKADPAKISLDEADVIVSGGKGVGSRKNFKILEEIAKHLGGVVAGSLGAVDEGWLPRKKLVGQTGTTVTPKLYIACGISGSIYHVLGMRDSEFVMAINKDPTAPIFKVADMSIIGDVAEVLSAIINQLRGLAQNTAKDNSEVSDTREI
jgi:electron transfer flavoprotein alpha subunit